MKLKYNKYLWFAIVGILFILAFTIRFYQLNNPDHGFYLDEAAIGYNAYSILKQARMNSESLFPFFFVPLPILKRRFTFI